MKERDSILKLHDQNDQPVFYIGKVSHATGASPKAIRHYEAIGLLPKARRKGTYRIYSERDVFLVHMIKHSQTVGFTLSQIQTLVSGFVEEGSFPLPLANNLFDEKKKEIQGKIDELEQLQDRLENLYMQMNRAFTQ